MASVSLIGHPNKAVRYIRSIVCIQNYPNPQLFVTELQRARKSCSTFLMCVVA